MRAQEDGSIEEEGTSEVTLNEFLCMLVPLAAGALGVAIIWHLMNRDSYE